MLDQELITLSKLRTAFDLKSTELETLTIKLLPHVTPYTLWYNAYKMHWESHIESNAALLELKIPTFPQANAEQFSVSDCAEEMCKYLGEIMVAPAASAAASAVSSRLVPYTVKHEEYIRGASDLLEGYASFPNATPPKNKAGLGGFGVGVADHFGLFD